MISKLKLFFILLVLGSLQAFGVDDSTGVVLKNGKVFKIHKVEKGEGLYAVARKYRVPVADIRDANPGSEKGINLNQSLWIPTHLTEKEFFGNAIPVYSNSKSTYKKPDNVSKSKQQAEPDAANKESFTTFYTVQRGETLYSIAQKFSTTPEFLIQLNRLSGAQLLVGKDLLVPISDPQLTPNYDTLPPSGPPTITPSLQQPAHEGTVLKDSVYTTYQIRTEHLPEYNVEKVVETGLGKISGDKKLRKGALAMHHQAPENTILRVTNPANGQSAYVKVYKSFARPKDQAVFIYLNKETAASLGLDSKNIFNIQVSFAR